MEWPDTTMRRRGSTWAGVALLLLSSAAPVMAADAVNAIRTMTTVGSNVEIVVESTKAFAVRALPTVLQIGSAEFILSRPPQGGSLNTLIFIVPASEFADVPNGAPVVVKYGLGEGSDVHGSFGPLDKTQLAN